MLPKIMLKNYFYDVSQKGKSFGSKPNDYILMKNYKVSPGMDWPLIQGVSLPMVQDAGKGSSIPATLRNGLENGWMNRWIDGL